MKIFPLLGLTIWLLVSSVTAQQSSDEHLHNPYDRSSTLKFYLQPSDYVVVGILKTPVTGGVGGGPIATPGYPVLSGLSSIADIEVQEVIKGGSLPTGDLSIEMCILYVTTGYGQNLIGQPLFTKDRPAQPEDPAPFGYRLGAKYIFFLQKIPADSYVGAGGKQILLRTVDPWFGVLPFSETLVLGLRQAIATPK